MRPTELYRTGTGQVVKVHAADDCRNLDGTGYCPIHNPAPGPWREWLTHWSEDRRIMERICGHGIHHPAVEHGGPRPHRCDGCPCFYTIIEGEIV